MIIFTVILLTAIATAIITVLGAVLFGSIALLRNQNEANGEAIDSLTETVEQLDRKIDWLFADAKACAEDEEEDIEFSIAQLVQVSEVLQGLPDDRKSYALRRFEDKLCQLIEQMGGDRDEN